MNLDVLAIGAHPDDIELGCSGTLLKLIDKGKKVGLLDLTLGELGTRGTAETRKAEALKSMDILGCQIRENLGFKDGFFQNDNEHKLKIIEKIRHYKPTIVLCNSKTDRHPDHGRAAALVYEACFLSGLSKIKTCDQDNCPQLHFRPKHIFNYIQWDDVKPDFLIDISNQLDRKVQCCLSYKTQFFDPNSKEQQTVIATLNFQESITYRAKNLGRFIGCEAAEGFTTNSFLAFEDFDSFI